MAVPSAEFTKIPPHSLDAERGVLGAVLLEKDTLIKIADMLQPRDFYDPKHERIYSAMLDLFAGTKPIDLLTLSQKLEDHKQLEALGGRAYLAELTDAAPTSAHLYEYAQIVLHKSTLRKLLSAGQKIAGLAFESDADVNAQMEKAEQTLFGVTQQLVKDKFVHIREILSARFDVFSEAKDAADEGREVDVGVPSGFHALDHLMGGFKPTDFLVLAARPSMGKTALALGIAQNAALKFGKSVGVLSLEMSKEQLVDRMFASLLGVDSWKLQKGKLDDADFARIGGVMDELRGAKIFIDDSVGSNILEVRAKARRLQMEHGLDMIIIDYLQLLSSNTSWGGNRVQEIGEISRSIKQLARELRVPILALSQLSRAVESRPGKIPQLADLRESGAIEQDADVVMMLYREDYYEADSSRPGMTDVYIRKNRNGPTAKIELLFKKEQLRFYDVDAAHAGGGGSAGKPAVMSLDDEF